METLLNKYRNRGSTLISENSNAKEDLVQLDFKFRTRPSFLNENFQMKPEHKIRFIPRDIKGFYNSVC